MDTPYLVGMGLAKMYIVLIIGFDKSETLVLVKGSQKKYQSYQPKN